MTEAAETGEATEGTEGTAATETTALALAAYTRVYEEHNARLVAYAITLTGNPSTAEDLVAEAHFRVWRRISAGHAVENVPAYLATTIRNLAHTLRRATAEIPLPTGTPEAEAQFGRPGVASGADDLSQQVAHVDFVTRLLKDLPERWVQALWLSEVEDLPLEAVGQRIGANSNATAVLLNRAREGLRQAFLRGYPGTPAAEACAKHWQKMPSLVRGSLSARQTDSLRAHAEQCDDCQARMAALQQVNLRLPALLGPALLALGLGGGALRVLGAGAAVGGAAKTAGSVGGKLRHGVSHRAGKAAAVSAGVAESAAIAVAAVALTGGAAHPSVASQTPAETQPANSSVPVAKTVPSKPASKPAPANPQPSTPQPKPIASQPSATPSPTPTSTPTSTPTAPTTSPSSSTTTPSTPSSPPTKPDHDLDVSITVDDQHQVTVIVHLAPPSKSPG